MKNTREVVLLVAFAISTLGHFFEQGAISKYRTIVAEQKGSIDGLVSNLNGLTAATNSCTSALEGLTPPSKPKDSACAVVHEKNNQCPVGYKKETKPRFTEKDGSKQFACVSEEPGKEPCTDVLRSGESETITIPVVPMFEQPRAIEPSGIRLGKT